MYVVSKNDEADVKQAFQDLKIDKDIFTWIIANWDPKFANIERLIQIGKIRPETAIFIDDNVLELNEVKSKIAEIYILDAVNFDWLLEIDAVKNKKVQADNELTARQNRYRTALKTEFLKESFKGDDREFYRKLKRGIIGINFYMINKIKT